MRSGCKVVLLVLLSFILAFSFCAFAEEVIPVSGVQISVNKITVMAGETTDPIEYIIKPDNASNKSVLWSSDDETIASVNEKGAISGKKAGTTKIRITAEDTSKGNKTANISVVVIQPVNALSLDVSELKIGIGSKGKVNAEVMPEDATNKKLSWTSSDQSIAQVSSNGDITGRGVGTAVITCEAQDGSGAKSIVSVTVFQPVKAIQLSQKQLTAFVGKTSDALTFTVSPENAEYKSVTWSSSDESIATVNDKGEVTGVATGTVNITATSVEPVAGNAKAQKSVCQVKVIQAVEAISVDQEEIKIGKGARARIVSKVEPETATNKQVKWTSADEKIARVAGDGTITGTGQGVTTVTCEAADGSGISASIQVTVFQPVQSIKLNTNKLAAFVGKKSDPLIVTISPADAEYQDYTWSSSDESIATVNEEGVVTGVSGGKVIITATSNEPISGTAAPKSATCQIQVTQSVGYIWLDKDEAKSTDKKLALKLTVLPETATNKSVVWSSSNKKVATVKNGVVRIRKHEGTTTITATAKDGSGIYASCDVSVWFSGSVIQIGSFVMRSGTYTWDVGNFTGNGVLESSDTNKYDLEGAGIPSDATVYNGHAYKLFNQSIPWSSAKEKCETAGGHLATITSAEEQSYIEQLIRGKGEFWIGLNRIDDDSFAWITGEPLVYSNWGDGEPNNYVSAQFSGENVVAVRPDWNDYNENDLGNITGFICEWDLEEVV